MTGKNCDVKYIRVKELRVAYLVPLKNTKEDPLGENEEQGRERREGGPGDLR